MKACESSAFEEAGQRILAVGVMPMFLIAAALYFWIDSPHLGEIELFIDQWLPSRGGLWISSTPLLCKAIASYMAMAMPVLTFAMICALHQHQPVLDKIRALRGRRLLQAFAAVILANALFVNVFYFNAMDLDNNRRGEVFANPVMIVLVSSALMWFWSLILLLTYQLFIYRPLTVLKGRRVTP